MDLILLKNETFGVGVDVYSDAEIHEINLGLGFWDLTILINKPSPAPGLNSPAPLPSQEAPPRDGLRAGLSFARPPSFYLRSGR
jgi:hypothetical protein